MSLMRLYSNKLLSRLRRPLQPRHLSASTLEPEPVASLAGRSLLSIADLSKEELTGLLQLSQQLRAVYRDDPRDSSFSPCAKRSMSMIFQKRSTRTRVSSETGMFLLGGHALFLGPSDIQLGVNETLLDTAKVLSRFNDVILARVFGHADVEELAAQATVPVINALSDLHHPLQTLADLMTLQDHFGSLEGKTLAWVGDGNNVLHDLMYGSAKMGMNLQVGFPKGYEPNAGVLEHTEHLSTQHSTRVLLTPDPVEAVKDAHVVVTDTWVSMGQEDEYKQRVKDFDGYCVSTELMANADKDAVFLHCLPRHPEEVTDEVFYSDRSLVFPEAENRMWTVMAVIYSMLGK